jgi:hypothetical protein
MVRTHVLISKDISMIQPTLRFTFTLLMLLPTGIESAPKVRNHSQITKCPSITWTFIYNQYRSLYTTYKILNLLTHCPQQNQPCHCANKFVINRCTHSSRQRRDRRAEMIHFKSTSVNKLKNHILTGKRCQLGSYLATYSQAVSLLESDM